MGHSLISGTVNSVAQPVLSSLSDERERQQRAFRKMLRFTAFISFPAMLGLSLIAPELIMLTITDKWLPSASILQLLCIGGAFIPITNLYSNLVISKGKSDIYMWNTISLGIIQLTTMLLLYPYGVHTMIIVYVSINICMATNTAQLVRSTERHPSVCLHSYCGNGSYLLCHYRLCQSVFINGKQDYHSRHTLHSHPVVERLCHF